MASSDLHARHLGLFPIAIAAICLTLASGTANGVGSVSTVSPRPLAMGGAFTAVTDELAAASWNPAGLNPPRCVRGINLRVHSNILGGPAVIRDTGLLKGVYTEPYRKLSGGEQFVIAVGSVAKGATLRRGGLSVGLLLLEEQLDPVGLEEHQGLADSADLLDAYYTAAAVSFNLAPSVSIGVSQIVFAGWDASGRRSFGGGRVYGAMLDPNSWVTVGFTYYDAAEGFGHYRRDIEGLGDRTMNAGLSFKPTGSVMVALDLRDLAEKHAETALEPRLGVEWNLWGQGALRGGIYREDAGEATVLSLGAGAIPMVGCAKAGDWLRSDGFVVNYAVLLKKDSGPRHLVSVMLHF